jgi:DNA-binding CsgD family transcriptional regulator
MKQLLLLFNQVLFILFLGINTSSFHAQTTSKILTNSFKKDNYADLLFTFQKEILELDSNAVRNEISYFKKIHGSNSESMLFADLLQAMYLSGGKQSDYDKSISKFEKINTQLENKKKLSPFEKNILAISYQSIAGIYIHKIPNKERFALRFYLKSEQLFQEIGYKKAVGGFQALSSLGEFYFRMKEYSTSMEYLKKAEKIVDQEKYDWAKINFYNTKGLTHFFLKENDLAIKNYKKVLTFIHDKKDSIWVGIVYGNIASDLMKLGKYNNAKEYLLIDLDYSIQFDERESIFELYCALIETEVALNKLESAFHYIQEAEKMKDILEDEYYIMRIESKKTLYYEAKKDFQQAFRCLKLASEIRQRIDKKLKQNKILASAKEFELELKQEKLNRLKIEQESALFQRNLFIVIGILGFFTLLFVIRSIRINNQKKQEALLYEQKLLQQELNNADQQMNLFRENINKQNEFIETIHEELEVLRANNQFVENENLLEKLNKINIVTQQDWIHFSNLFSRIHPTFIQQLSEKYPSLTNNEIRLLVLTKLQYSTKEMASMLGVSLDAIHKSRYRLRKKLNLPEEDDFSGLIEI